MLSTLLHRCPSPSAPHPTSHPPPPRWDDTNLQTIPLVYPLSPFPWQPPPPGPGHGDTNYNQSDAIELPSLYSPLCTVISP